MIHKKNLKNGIIDTVLGIFLSAIAIIMLYPMLYECLCPLVNLTSW